MNLNDGNEGQHEESHNRKLAAELVGHRRAIELLIEPVRLQDRILYVRSPDTSAEMRRKLRLFTRHDVSIEYANANDVLDGIVRTYGAAVQAGTMPEIIEIWHETLAQAADMRAANILIEWSDNQPGREDMGRIRLDVDGNTFVIRYLDYQQFTKLVGMIGELAVSGDVVNPQVGQRGTLTSVVDGRTINLRYSSYPQDHPRFEGLLKLVLRVLHRHEFLPTLEQIGLDPDQRELLQAAMIDPRCVLIIGAPPGAGKTTTLYALMMVFDFSKDSVFTIEDPPESHRPGTTPTRIARSRQWDTEAALTEILRQQPTAVIVGELLEPNVASLAMKASKRGVRMATTIHATDARAIIDALLNFDISDRTVAHGPTMLVSQRLVSVLCSNCKRPDVPSRTLLSHLDRLAVPHDDLVIYKMGDGCDACLDRGTEGRYAIFETISITRAMRNAIMSHDDDEFLKQARHDGYVTIFERSLVHILNGNIGQNELDQLPSSDAHELPLSPAATSYNEQLRSAAKSAKRKKPEAA